MEKILIRYSNFLEQQFKKYDSDSYKKCFYITSLALVVSLISDLDSGRLSFATGLFVATFPAMALSFALSKKKRLISSFRY